MGPKITPAGLAKYTMPLEVIRPLIIDGSALVMRLSTLAVEPGWMNFTLSLALTLNEL